MYVGSVQSHGEISESVLCPERSKTTSIVYYRKNQMTNETKIRLKLPAEVTIHIPSFSDITLEHCFEIAAKDGVRLIERTIAEMIAKEVLKRHSARIEKLVNQKTSEIEDSIILKVVEKMQVK